MQYIDEKDFSGFTKVDTTSWESMKDNIFIRMINQKSIPKYSENIVQQKFLDLAMCVSIQERKNDTLRSHMMTNEDLEKYGVDIDTVYEVARKNTSACRSKRIFTPTEHMCMNNTAFPLLGEINGKPCVMVQGQQVPLGIIGGTEDEETILIVCDKKNMYGSAYMSSYDVLEEVYSRFNNTNFYIIPTSVYSVMCIKESFVTHGGTKDTREAEDDLFDMLEEMNDKQQNWKDILSYKIYYYYGNDGKQLFLIK